MLSVFSRFWGPSSAPPRPAKPRSLQAILTVQIAMLITLGFSSVTLWTVWKTQDILISGHKDALEETARRIGSDVQVYRDMLPEQEGIQKALNNRIADNLWIGLQRPDGAFIVADTSLTPKALRLSGPEVKQLSRQLSFSLMPTIHQAKGRDIIACAGPLLVQQNNLGTLYLIHDINDEQQQFYQLIRNLVLANIVTLVLLIASVAYSTRRLLKPLRQASQMTQTMSASDLGHKSLVIDHAPQEIQELIDAFNRLLARLSEAWQHQQTVTDKQRQFVSNVSHELRTPLSIVRGYLESVLRRGQSLTDHQQEAIQIAVSETDHTICVLKDLLDLARADDGHMHYQSELLILNDVVSEVIKLATQVSHREIVLDHDDLIPVYADAHRLKQVLINLVDNAVKYADAKSPIHIKLEYQQHQALIHVCDRGPGIELKHQSRIFERFYRVDAARTRSTGGTGLGLSLVDTFVSGMGGQVTVRSTPGQGSQFTVSLPTSPPVETVKA